MEEKVVHKPGWTKQQNKPHKSKHRTKGEIGKMQKPNHHGADEQGTGLSASRQASKQQRKLRAKQLSQNKRDNTLKQNRMGYVSGTMHFPPRVIAVLALSESVDVASLSDALCQVFQAEAEHKDEGGMHAINNTNAASTTASQGNGIGGVTLYSAKFKTRVNLFPVKDRNDLMAVLDIGKVADMLLLVTHAHDCLNNKRIVDPHGYKIISLMKEQGLPTVMGLVQGLNTIDTKFRTPCKKSVTEFFEGNFYVKTRVLTAETEGDYAQLVRFLCEQPIAPLNWRKIRPYMMVDKIDWIPNQMNQQSSFGTLKLSGFLRGNKLDPNNILHIVGYGDAQVLRVTGGADPYGVKTPHVEKKNKKKDPGMREENHTLPAVLPGQEVVLGEPNDPESLVRHCPQDPFAAEQTWPSPEELAAAEKEGSKEMKLVPKGTSPYQAAWIPDLPSAMQDGQQQEEDSSEDSDEAHVAETALDGEMENDEKEKVIHYDSEDDFGDDFDETGSFAKVSMKMRPSSLEDEARDYEEFPDEVETPLNEMARIRFRKYRGLKSFRTSPWPAKENLPVDYSRIFQFENFRATQKRILKGHQGVEAGQYITIYVKDICNTQFANHAPNRPLLVCGLHKYENKMSVLNMSITRVPSYTAPIKSTQRVLAQVGFRRYDASPVYSDISVKCDKFKVNKFLSGTAMATVIAPICFAPTPVLFFSAETAALMAIGQVSSVNPDRIMLKKIVLSGIPMRVGKNKALVKDMFFNAEDVNWFRPVDLWTKYGKSGRIVDSIGTHGHMKCVFDACLTQQDTVMMSLYKRIYPKWVTLPELVSPEGAQQQGDGEMM